MNYISAKDISKKWGISERRVQSFCASGKIPGAKQLGRQWVIPEKAIRPIDGRTKAGKLNKDNYSYHFPLFLFNTIYTHPENLSEGERSLFNAQVLHSEGNYIESIKICNQLLSETNNEIIRFACYITLSYNFMLLAVYSEFKKYLKLATDFTPSDPSLSEDINLIKAGLMLHVRVDSSYITKINPEAISRESQIYYMYLNLMCTSILKVKETPYALSFYRALSSNLDNIGLPFASLSIHCLIYTILVANDDLETAKSHLYKACDIAIENNIINSLSKYALMCMTQISSYLTGTNSKYLAKLKQQCNQNLINWRLTSNLENEITPLKNFDIEDIELTIFISYNTKINDIAKVLGVNVKTVKEQLNKLYNQTGCSNTKELTAYVQNQYKQLLINQN